MTHGALPQNLSLEWPSVWRGKSLKLLRKMKDSRGPGGVVYGAMPQNLSLEWPSVWGGKSLKFLRKMKDSRGPGGCEYDESAK